MGIAAAAYYRMSSDDQSDSLDQQKTAVRAYAVANGLDLVTEFYEPGKSGSLRQKDRKEWARLMEDCERGKYQAIIAWDLSRLSRADPLKAAADKDRLRTAGVFVQTVREGRIDWDSFSGRLFDYVSQEKNHQYSKELAKNTIRGREALLARGESPIGLIPYGYRRRYVGPSGEYVAKRGEKFRKPKGWTRIIEIEPEEADVVREIFSLYLDRAWTMRQIAVELTNRGVPAPAATMWRHVSIANIVENPAYSGVLSIRDHRTPKGREHHSEMTPCQVSGIYPAILAPGVFEAARAIQQSRRPGRSGQRVSGLFSGVLICGNCGGPLARGRDKRTGAGLYRCSRKTGQPLANTCGYWSVSELDLIVWLLPAFVRACDRDLLESIRVKRVINGTSTERLTARLAALKAKVKRARSRYVSCPDDLLPEVEAALKSLVAEQERVERELKAASGGTDENDQLRKWWAERRGRLIDLRPCHPRMALTQEWPIAELDSVRGLFKRLEFKASIWWKTKKVGKLTRHEVDWARLSITLADKTSHTGRIGEDP